MSLSGKYEYLLSALSFMPPALLVPGCDILPCDIPVVDSRSLGRISINGLLPCQMWINSNIAVRKRMKCVPVTTLP